MKVAYKLKSVNNVIDMRQFAFKDKDCELLIFEIEPNSHVSFGIPRNVKKQSKIDEYNKISLEGEIQDKKPIGSYGRIEDRYLIHTPIKDGDVWVIIDTDDLDILR